MDLASALVPTMTAALLVLAAVGQLSGNATQLEALDAVRVPRARVRLIANTQLAGALGLLAGIGWRPLGLAAAVGVVLMFVIAVGLHLRARRYNVLPAVVMLALGVASFTLFVRA